MSRMTLSYLLLTMALLAGCAGLPAGSDDHQRIYQLLPPELPLHTGDRLPADLMVTRLTSRPGYDSSAMIYRRSDYELRYFARSRWTDPPTRMLQPVLISALNDLGPFRHVIAGQSGIPADYRLDAELVRLEQDFRQRPSQVRLTLFVRLMDEKTRQVRLSHTLTSTAAAGSDDPEGGAIAANAALEDLVRELSGVLRRVMADETVTRASD